MFFLSACPRRSSDNVAEMVEENGIAFQMVPGQYKSRTFEGVKTAPESAILAPRRRSSRTGELAVFRVGDDVDVDGSVFTAGVSPGFFPGDQPCERVEIGHDFAEVVSAAVGTPSPDETVAGGVFDRDCSPGRRTSPGAPTPVADQYVVPVTTIESLQDGLQGTVARQGWARFALFCFVHAIVSRGRQARGCCPLS